MVISCLRYTRSFRCPCILHFHLLDFHGIFQCKLHIFCDLIAFRRCVNTLRKHIINYAKTREVYVAYRKAGYSKKFLAEHEGDILLHKAAKKAFDEMGIKKLPTVKSIQAEYAGLLAEKKTLYPEYSAVRQEMKDLQMAKANVARLLGYEEKTQKNEKSKETEQFSNNSR